MTGMREIEIVKRNVLDNEYVVYPVSYINPMMNIVDLDMELQEKIGMPCNVLVDLLLCNGNNFNRFIKFHFDGKRIDRLTIETTKLNGKEENDINEFYRKNRSIIKNGVLAPSEYLRYVK